MRDGAGSPWLLLAPAFIPALKGLGNFAPKTDFDCNLSGTCSLKEFLSMKGGVALWLPTLYLSSPCRSWGSDVASSDSFLLAFLDSSLASCWNSRVLLLATSRGDSGLSGVCLPLYMGEGVLHLLPGGVVSMGTAGEGVLDLLRSMLASLFLACISLVFWFATSWGEGLLVACFLSA